MLQIDSMELASAESTIERAAVHARSYGLTIRGDEAVGQTFVRSWACGALGGLSSLLEVLHLGAPDHRGWAAALALARTTTGDTPGARELAQMIAMPRSLGSQDLYTEISAAFLSELAFFIGEPAAAAGASEQLGPVSGGRVLLGVTLDLGPVDRYLAPTQAALGAEDEAQRLRARARTQAGCQLWEARTDVDERATGNLRPSDGSPWSWIEVGEA